jgi:DNA-directed RNA polymerase sigma subunit (sigma70/sigma32)
MTNNEHELINLDPILDKIDQSAPTQEELEWAEIEKILNSPTLTEQEREILEMEFDLD